MAQTGLEDVALRRYDVLHSIRAASRLNDRAVRFNASLARRCIRYDPDTRNPAVAGAPTLVIPRRRVTPKSVYAHSGNPEDLSCFEKTASA